VKVLSGESKKCDNNAFFLFNAIIQKGHGYSSYIPCTLGNKKLTVAEGKDIYIQ
jgi:hypothetical protein